MPQDDKTRAKALVDKYRGNVYGGAVLGINADGLCDEMSKTVMRQPLTVFEVFNVINERGYTQAELEAIATNLMARINPTNLIELAKSKSGVILLDRVSYLMNCAANNGQPICQRIDTAHQRANGTLREEEKKLPNDTGQIRRLTDEEIQYYKAKVPKGGKFNEDIVWELPESGTGYTVYNPKDVAADGLDQIGTLEIIEAMIAIAAAWAADSNHSKLQYGDVSRAGGLKFSELAGHKTHKVGLAFDMRILRLDKAMLGLNISTKAGLSQYDRKATKEFVQLVRRLYPETTVYLNDSELQNDLKGIVQQKGGHDDHLHVMPFTKGREE